MRYMHISIFRCTTCSSGVFRHVHYALQAVSDASQSDSDVPLHLRQTQMLRLRPLRQTRMRPDVPTVCKMFSDVIPVPQMRPQHFRLMQINVPPAAQTDSHAPPVQYVGVASPSVSCRVIVLGVGYPGARLLKVC